MDFSSQYDVYVRKLRMFEDKNSLLYRKMELNVTGWRTTFLSEKFDKYLNKTEKQMLQVTKDTLVRAERDLILEYKRKALLTDRIKKVDYSRISQEVEQLLEKKPFHRRV